jgi:hypothetical protein
VIISASSAIWSRLAVPAVPFVLDHPLGPEPFHLALGQFTHLAALSDPSPEEQTLINSPTPCFARVYPHQQRLLAGYSGPLACSYVPITVAEAVNALGFARILAQVDAATRTAAQALMSEDIAQTERNLQLLRLERMLGWEPDPALDAEGEAARPTTRLMLALIGADDRQWLVPASASVGLVAVLTYMLLGIPYALLAVLVVVVSLVIWKATSTLGA